MQSSNTSTTSLHMSFIGHKTKSPSKRLRSPEQPLPNNSQLKDDREDIANWKTHVACLVNEQGRLLKLEPNLNLEQFVGTVYMYRSFNNSVTGDEAYASLTEQDYAMMGLPVPATKAARGGDDAVARKREREGDDTADTKRARGR